MEQRRRCSLHRQGRSGIEVIPKESSEKEQIFPIAPARAMGIFNATRKNISKYLAVTRKSRNFAARKVNGYKCPLSKAQGIQRKEEGHDV